MLKTFATSDWDEHFPDSTQQQAIQSLEQGDVLYFPHLAFSLSADEKFFLTSDYADPKTKNISYHPIKNKISGIKNLNRDQQIQLTSMLARFSRSAFNLLKELLPRYAPYLIMARTSFRPVEIIDRVTSKRKDDKRLHVDAFPSSPNQGKRILRVFCNINPNGCDRVWRLGEPFEKVAEKFLPQAKKPLRGSATLLNILKITKSYRTLYDHYMIQIHDQMKEDEDYQRTVLQQEVRFPPNSSWIVQTDHVSHAAMQGQYVLEQTFYLPIQAMQNETCSPLRILEKMLQKELV